MFNIIKKFRKWRKERLKNGFYPADSCGFCGGLYAYIVSGRKIYYNSNCMCLRYRLPMQELTKERFNKFLGREGK